MWILYIAIAIVVSTGTGVYLSRNVDVAIDDQARQIAPQVQAQQANQVARYLRRLYLEDPSLFPPTPSSGEIMLSNTLVGMAITQGNQLPSGVSFVLRSDGRILPVFAAGSNDLRDRMIQDTFERVVELDGVEPHLYGRRSGAIDRGYETVQVTRPSDVVIVDDPDSGGSGVWGDGTVDTGGENTGGDGLGGTQGGGGDTGGGTGTPGTGGGDTGGEGTGGEGTGGEGTGGTDGDTEGNAENTDSELTVEDLNQGGGSGGSSAVNPESYRIGPDGHIYVTPGYETALGPRAPFYSSEQLESFIAQVTNEKSRNMYVPSNYMLPLYFDAFNIESQSRTESEEIFANLCTGVIDNLSTTFEARIEQAIFDVIDLSEFYQEEECDPRDDDATYNACMDYYDPSDVTEDLTTVAATVATAGGYCMSVMTAREADFPVRANRGNITNEDALEQSISFIEQFRERAWYMQANDAFFETRQPSSLIEIKEMLNQTENVNNVRVTYPVTDETQTTPASTQQP